MKGTNFYLIGILSGLLFVMISCNADNESNLQKENFDTRTYSGVLIGSTGAYKLNISRSGIGASVLFDGNTYTFSSSESLENEQSLNLNDGTVSLTIEVDSNGNNPEVAFTIPGHTIQSTIVLSNPTNPNQNYIGVKQRVTQNGTKIYESTFNLTLYDGNKWMGIERVDLDIDPFNPNHQSTQGQVTFVDGTYTENDEQIYLAYSNGTTIYTLFKIGDNLSFFHESETSFAVELTQVNF